MWGCGMEIVQDRVRRLDRSADMRTMSGGLELDQLTAGDPGVEVTAHLDGGQCIVGTLQYQRGDGDISQQGSVVAQECHPGELAGDLGIGLTEAPGQFGTEL